MAAIRNTGIDPNEPVTPQLRRKSKERMERLEPDIRITPVRVPTSPLEIWVQFVLATAFSRTFLACW